MVLPPTTDTELDAVAETIYAMVGEEVWKASFGDEALGPQDLLPTQLHSILAHQARVAAGLLTAGGRGDNGQGKGKKSHEQY